MATTNHEKYSRLALMLVSGGTSLTRVIFEKYVKERTPEGHDPFPWTVGEFLSANKHKIIGSQTGRNKERMFFPGVTGINMEQWDLYMFCFLLTDVLEVTRTVRMDVNQLRKMRNKLCHLREPSIDNDKYISYVDKIEVIFERLLAEIDDQNFKIEIDGILRAAKEGPLSLRETLNVMHKFYSMEGETREILSQHTKDIKGIIEKLQEIERKQDMYFKDRLPNDIESVKTPEAIVELLIKNCVSEKEKFLSKLLVNMYKEATGGKTDSSGDISPETHSKLMEAVRDTIERLASQDRQIVDAEQKCVIFRIKCTSVSSFLSLFEDCMEGYLTKDFRPLEDAIRQIDGLEEVSVEAVMYKDELLKSISKIVSSLEEIISMTYNTSFQSRERIQNGEIHGISDVNLVERFSPTNDDEQRTGHSVRLTINTDHEGKEHLQKSIESGSLDSSINRLREAIVEQYDLNDLSIEAKLCNGGASGNNAGTSLYQKSEDSENETKKLNIRGKPKDQRGDDLSHLSLKKYLVREQEQIPEDSLVSIVHPEPSHFTTRDKDLPADEESSLLTEAANYMEQIPDKHNNLVVADAGNLTMSSDFVGRWWATRDSGIGSDIASGSLETISNAAFSSDVLYTRDEDCLSPDDENHKSIRKYQSQTEFYEEPLSNTKSDELLIKNGVYLNESYLTQIRTKFSKSKRYYDKLLEPKQLEKKIGQNPQQYVPCILHLEGPHQAYCLPTSNRKQLRRIEISGRSNIGQTFNEDEVVVEILDTNHKSEAQNGRVLGVLKRQRYKDLRHPVFLCTPDETESHIVRPLCTTVPKINVLQEKIRKKFKTPKARLFKIDIYEYDEHAGKLHSPRTETLSRAEIQSCIFLVAFISWELNQVYPMGAVLKIFPCWKNIRTGLSILNLRYGVSQHFSKDTDEEMKALLNRVCTAENLAESEFQDDDIHDITDLRTFTIDKHDTKDLNYAFSIQTQVGYFKIGVHVSDVSLYVTKGSPIDEDAFKRAMTIYTDVDLPRYMFPDQIALEHCSLLANEKRPVISIYLFLDENGRPVHSDRSSFLIERSLIKCCRNFSYKEAQQRLNGKKDDDALTDDLKSMFRVISKERRNRFGKSMNTLGRNEIVSEKSMVGCLETHCLSEELVVLANKTVAYVLCKKKIHLPLLTQLPSNQRDLEILQKKYGSYLGVLVHFQMPNANDFPNLTLEHVLETNSRNHLMVVEPVWNTFKSSPETSVENIVNDNMHPLQCVMYQEWLSIQGVSFYMCSNTDQDASDNRYGLSMYAQCTAPTRRYGDLVVQRQLHFYLDKRKHANLYNRTEVDKICSHLNHVSKTLQRYQSDCKNLRFATQLRQRPQIKTCFVKAVSESSINVVCPERMYDEFQDIELPFKLLDLSNKPEISENRNTHLQQVTGKWRKRFYDTTAIQLPEENKGTEAEEKVCNNDSRQSQHVQTLNHNKDVLFIKLNDWARILISALEARGKDLEDNIRMVSVNADNVGENDISTDCSEINSHTIFSFIFHTGQPLKIQMSAEHKQGIVAPKPALFEMSESVTLCLQHLDDPVFELSQYAISPAQDQYATCTEYRDTWLPIVSMEAAVGAICNEDTYYVRNVQVKILGETRGQFSLPVLFCARRNIGLSGVICEDTESTDEDETGLSHDWICIRKRVSEKQRVGTEQTCREYHWIGHAVITDVQKKRTSKRFLAGQNYVVTFELHTRSGIFPETMKNAKEVTCHVEVLRKTEVDRRIERNLKILPTKGHRLAVQIALKRKQNEVEFERKQISNNIRRDVIISLSKDDPTKRPLPRNNAMQQKAIDMALRNQFSLIHGPPGTGKTYTAIKLIYLFNQINNILYKQYMKLKKHVLFCGPSNKSVDQVGKWMIRRLGDLCPDFVRIYENQTESLDYPIPGISFTSKDSSIHRVDEELKNVSLHHLIRKKGHEYAGRINAMERRFLKENRRPDPVPYLDYLDVVRAATNAEIRKHDVILCTTEVASNSKILRAAGVYQIIVDEAGMCSEPQCLVTLLASKAEQVVLIGDHKQLRPIVKCSAAAELGLDKSLFERYATTKDNAAPFVMLEEQYRMNPSLCRFPSQYFYAGRLRTMPGPWQNETLKIWPTDVNGKQQTHVLIDVEGEEKLLTVSTDDGKEQSKSNDAEKEKVINVYRYFIEENIPPTSINIISQYNAQCAEIREALKKEGFQNYIVNTVVSSQSGEWDYVIFSTVRSLPDYKIEPKPTPVWCKHNLRLITDKNQINVALTRARKGLVIIGNKNRLYCDPVWKNIVSYYEQRHCVKLPEEFPPQRRTRQDEQILRDAREQSHDRYEDILKGMKKETNTGSRTHATKKPYPKIPTKSQLRKRAKAARADTD